jgi:hypothetical protein
LRAGDVVECPAGLGRARLLEIGARLDLREPPQANLCKVELLADSDCRIRYFELWELRRVDPQPGGEPEGER